MGAEDDESQGGPGSKPTGISVMMGKGVSIWVCRQPEHWAGLQREREVRDQVKTQCLKGLVA